MNETYSIFLNMSELANKMGSSGAFAKVEP
jgi:hypothetical protein